VRLTEVRRNGALPVQPARHVRPAGQADPRRLHRLPDVDERMPDDEDVRTGDLRRDAALLRAGNQMVEQHPEAGVGPCAEVADDLDEVVSAFELLDDDALDPQVVTPDRLDELAVVNAFDEDPA